MPFPVPCGCWWMISGFRWRLSLWTAFIMPCQLHWWLGCISRVLNQGTYHHLNRIQVAEYLMQHSSGDSWYTILQVAIPPLSLWSRWLEPWSVQPWFVVQYRLRSPWGKWLLTCLSGAQSSEPGIFIKSWLSSASFGCSGWARHLGLTRSS